MEKINCLIVDDEPIAREIIEKYCNHLPFLHVAASCSNALEAKALLRTQDIGLIFLDISMPVLDGISFLKTLKHPPLVIFTTAYKEFAVDAFDLSASDYLLKPFSLDRFIVAVDRALEKLNPARSDNPKTDYPPADNFIFIKADGKIYKLLHDDLLFAEANGNYTRIVTMHRTILPVMPFADFEELLPELLFIRIHRSFIINISKITHIEGNRAFINNIEIPIGNNYKDNFLKKLGF